MTQQAVQFDFYFYRGVKYPIVNGPSRYQIMIAHWHHGPRGDVQEMLEFTIQWGDEMFASSSKQKVYLEIKKASRLDDSGEFWLLEGLAFLKADPLKIEDHESYNFSLQYNVKTRKGTLTNI